MIHNRTIYRDILGELGNSLIILLIGARQVGKTTLMRQIRNHVDATKKTFFLNLEDPDIKNLLNAHPNNIFEITGSAPKDQQAIFIDEVQYLNDPTNFLKYIYDEYKDTVKLIVSGSSSFYIDQKFRDSLIGRKKVFFVSTLDFEEFLEFKEETKIRKHLFEDKKVPVLEKAPTERLFLEYITYGGYPEIVLTNDTEKKIDRLYEYSYDYIKKDIYDAKIQDQDKFLSLLRLLANQTGELVNMNELANTLWLSQPTVEKYIFVMQKSFHVALIKPFSRNVRKELTKMPKIYFYDLGIRNTLLKNFENIRFRSDKWAYLENIVFRKLLHQSRNTDDIKFWRTQNQNEVDFIWDETRAYEVKFSQKQIQESKYAIFRENYPEIPLNYLCFEDIIEFIAK